MSAGIIMHASSPRRRFLSVWFRRLATDRIARASSAPAETPLAVVAEIKSARRIVALNDEAARLGLNAGMSLADARAMYPTLAAADAAPEAARRADHDDALVGTRGDPAGEERP